jgi:predicted DNA-binding transcriptional regulator AlpA
MEPGRAEGGGAGRRMKRARVIPYWPMMLNAEEAARYLGMSRSTFDKARKDGLLPCGTTTVYSLVRWCRLDLDAVIEAWRGQAANDNCADGDANPWDGAT